MAISDFLGNAGSSAKTFGGELVTRGKAVGENMTTLLQAKGQALGSALTKLPGQAIKRVENYATSYVENQISKLTGQLDNIFSQFGGISLLSEGTHEDFNTLKRINHQLVTTAFQLDYNFRLEIDGAPEDFEFYIKDLSFAYFDIATDEERYGSASMTWPTGDQPLRLTFTVRDNEDGRIAEFFLNWWSSIINSDGTVNVPSSYVKTATIYNITANGQESPTKKIKGYPSQVGDSSRAHENGQFMEFPVTFVQSSTINI